MTSCSGSRMDRARCRHAGRSRGTEDSHSLGDRLGMTGVHRWERDAKRKSNRRHLGRLHVHVSHAMGQKSRAGPKADPVRKLVRDGNSHDVAGERPGSRRGRTELDRVVEVFEPASCHGESPTVVQWRGAIRRHQGREQCALGSLPWFLSWRIPRYAVSWGEPSFQTGRRALQERDEGEDAAGERTETDRQGVRGSTCLDSGRLDGVAALLKHRAASLVGLRPPMRSAVRSQDLLGIGGHLHQEGRGRRAWGDQLAARPCPPRDASDPMWFVRAWSYTLIRRKGP